MRLPSRVTEENKVAFRQEQHCHRRCCASEGWRIQQAQLACGYHREGLPGDDRLVRAVEVRIDRKVYSRPVAKLVLLMKKEEDSLPRPSGGSMFRPKMRPSRKKRRRKERVEDWTVNY